MNCHTRCLLSMLLVCAVSHVVRAFSVVAPFAIGGTTTTRTVHRSASTRQTSGTALDMAKSINKQAELMKKMKQAKEQAARESAGIVDGGVDGGEESLSNTLSDEQVKERNDRLRFQELLDKGASMVLNDYSSDGYLNKQQEEEEINAACSGVDRKFEGDPAPWQPFEELVSIKSENCIGARAAERMCQRDYLVVFCDPRMNSAELHETVKNLVVDLPKPILSRVIVVNADTPAENRRWLKKDSLEDRIDVFSDEKREWMQAYTALGEKRWSMTMFVLADERVQKLAREVDQYAASRVIRNAVESLGEVRL